MTEQLLYLGDDPHRFLAVYRPPSEPHGRPAVLLAPPFGWDEIASHRALRDWAAHLAAHGHPVIRLDLPGTGDSAGGPADPGTPATWQAAVGQAAAWVRAEAAVQTVVGIGIGVGGLLVYEAAARGEVDHLVLWATPGRGRTLVRELSAFSALETARIVESGSPEPPPLPEQMLAPGGFVLSAETVAALSAVDLATRPLAPETRVLLLDRDGIKPDAALQAAVTDAGASLTVASGKGFSAMLAEPDRSRTPHEVFDTVQAWLDETAAAHAARRAGGAGRHCPRRSCGSTASASGRSRRLLPPAAWSASRPCREGERKPLTAVFLNAGAVRRIGPHRLWVDTARRWALRGVPSLRLDLEGIGDSDGDSEMLANVAEFYEPRFTEQVRAGLDRLEQERIGDRFVVVGLCSGSSWAFQAALEDPRIAAAFMINPRILYWDEALDVERDLRRTRLLVKPVIWKRILRGDVSADRFAAFLGWAAKAPARALARRTRPAEAVTDDRAGGAGIRPAAGRGDRAPVLLLRRRAAPRRDDARRSPRAAGSLAERRRQLPARPRPHAASAVDARARRRGSRRSARRDPGGLVNRDSRYAPRVSRSSDVWAERNFVGDYATRSLRPPEVVLLLRYADALAGRVLELGCGAGRITGYLGARGGDVLGIDISPTMVDYCRRRYPELQFQVGDLADLSGLADGSRDVVVAEFNVLGVLDDPERTRVLRELRRVLTDEGLLLFSAHNIAFLPNVPKPAALVTRSRNPARILWNLARLPCASGITGASPGSSATSATTPSSTTRRTTIGFCTTTSAALRNSSSSRPPASSCSSAWTVTAQPCGRARARRDIPSCTTPRAPCRCSPRLAGVLCDDGRRGCRRGRGRAVRVLRDHGDADA